MTNDVVFIMWHIIRDDSTLLTRILNYIIQFISRLQTELAVVKVSHRSKDCVFGKKKSTHIDTAQFTQVKVVLCSEIHSFPVEQELHVLWSGFQWPRN